MLAAYLIVAIGWRATFVVFSLVGVVWAAAFYWWFRDDPADHPRVNVAEQALIAAGNVAAPQGESHPSIPWKVILSSANIWLLGTVQTCSSFVSYMYHGLVPDLLADRARRRPDRNRLAHLAGAVRRGGRLPGQRIHQRLAGAGHASPPGPLSHLRVLRHQRSPCWRWSPA